MFLYFTWGTSIHVSNTRLKCNYCMFSLNFTTILSNTRRQIGHISLIFPWKQTLTFHANCLLRRQFAWNIKGYFLLNKKKMFQNVASWTFYSACSALRTNACIIQDSFLLLYCYICDVFINIIVDKNVVFSSSSSSSSLFYTYDLSRVHF